MTSDQVNRREFLVQAGTLGAGAFLAMAAGAKAARPARTSRPGQGAE
jgi:hypothetical protein